MSDAREDGSAFQPKPPSPGNEVRSPAAQPKESRPKESQPEGLQPEGPQSEGPRRGQGVTIVGALIGVAAAVPN